jgi:PhzF family phenazine biosynthesis protein
MPTCSFPFTVLDVFTTTRFQGNQLAIVNAGAAGELSTSQLQQIAREFNFSETVFYFPPLECGDIRIRIFDPDTELQLAGHPIIGSGHYFFSGLSGLEIPRDAFALVTNAGRVPTMQEGENIKVEIPHEFKIHDPALKVPEVRAVQTGLLPCDFAGAEELEVVSIVKGMNFILLEVTSEDALARTVPFPKQPVLPEGYLGDWEMGTGMNVFVYYVQETGKIRTRMYWGEGKEDAATGSASCALAGYLAVRRGMRKLEMVQGVEMGRRSRIEVEVGVKDGEVERVTLMGTAVRTMEGVLHV